MGNDIPATYYDYLQNLLMPKSILTLEDKDTTMPQNVMIQIPNDEAP
jgi:hypothetical protein